MLVTSIVEANAASDARPWVSPGAQEGHLALEALPPLGIAIMMSPGIANVMTMPNGAVSEGTTSPHDMTYASNAANDQLSLPTAADDAYQRASLRCVPGPGGVTLPEARETAAKAGGHL
jgi:hypothetical protein